MIPALAKVWPPLAAAIVLWLAVGAILIPSIERNGGHLVYALDDPYISMAMAKNFAEHGVWGVTRHHFSSSSSSLAWPLLLAGAYRLLGTQETAPLLLNLIIATALLFSMHRLVEKHAPSPVHAFLVLAGTVVLVPLPTLILSGLEHALHTLLTILLAQAAARELAKESAVPAWRPFWPLGSLAVVVVLTRFEGLFLVCSICMLLALRRRWLASLSLAASSALPVLIYGWISMSRGWFFLPNPVVLKGNLTHQLDTVLAGGLSFQSFVKMLPILLGYYGFKRLIEFPPLLLLTLAALALHAVRSCLGRAPWEKAQVLLSLFVLTTLLHLQFAQTGWLYRYEAYLIGLGLLAVMVSAFDILGDPRIPRAAPWWRSRYVSVVVLALLPALALLDRARIALETLPRAMTNVYEQQYQMGLFLKEHYQGQRVVANDIGAINYLADIECIDLMGLASMEPARAWRLENPKKDTVRRLAAGARIAIAFDGVLQRLGGAPPEWIKAGEWTIRDNVVAPEDTVSFYATNGADAADLMVRLRRFASRLPPGVRQSGRYTTPGVR